MFGAPLCLSSYLVYLVHLVYLSGDELFVGFYCTKTCSFGSRLCYICMLIYIAMFIYIIAWIVWIWGRTFEEYDCRS